MILFSMVLHSASRLGVLSYLYQQRHEIGYTLGLIEEVPIAMCNSDYDFGAGLHFESHDTDSSLPPIAFTAHEIHLFYSQPEAPLNTERIITAVAKQSAVINRTFTSPPLSIFHPPC
ncbi:MAG: hypothetical protein KF856_11130 [Cyclobacteriaceae bacterium]|nr:hypothetical protein [Cyclobacteriaceae bacterium]